MSKAIWCSAQAWRSFYGQQLTEIAKPTEPLAFTLPSGERVLVEGWRTEQRGDRTVYVGPHGEVTDWIGHAYEMSRLEQDSRVQKGGTLAFVGSLLTQLKPGSCTERALRGSFRQLDDWHHRGKHPLLRGMSLYEYSTWVYRQELPLLAQVDESEPAKHKPRHLDVAFDETYGPHRTWAQRVALSPRVPRVEGMRFEADTNPEMHYLLKSILFRPLVLPDSEAFQSPERLSSQEPYKASELRILQMYKQLCTAPPGESPWPAQNGGPGSPGPFERGFKSFMAEQEALALVAPRKRVLTCTWFSLWETVEARYLLDDLADQLAAWEAEEDAEAARAWDTSAFRAYARETVLRARDDAMTADEFFALRTCALVQNFDGIAAASHEKPKRRITEDVSLLEEPVYREGEECGAEAFDRIEQQDEVANAGLQKITSVTALAHHFAPDEMRRILTFDTRDRTTSYSKELLELMPGMREGVLPAPIADARLEQRRTALRADIVNVYGGFAGRSQGHPGLAGIEASLLGTIQQKQQERAEGADDDVEPCDEVPPEDVPVSSEPLPAPAAVFAPDGRWRRPSDYVRHLMERFEQGLTGPKGKPPRPKKLSADQTCFLALFAEACNSAWEEERDEVPLEQRQTRHLMLVGQGGSGKTAIVQEIVLPALDVIFPPQPPDASSSLILCASWAQAENISTEVHRAVSCHNAAGMRPG